MRVLNGLVYKGEKNEGKNLAGLIVPVSVVVGYSQTGQVFW